jgi:nitroreductase
MTHNCEEMGCSACGGQSMENIQGRAAAGVNSFCESGFLSLAKRRFSVRKYKDTPVEPEMINTILEAGRVAPTGANLQPYKILLVKSKAGLEALSKGANIYGAPSAFIICSDTVKAFKRPYDGKSMSDIDASIVTDHMMLAAADLGMGSVWITYFDPQVIRREFNIPDNFEPVNILAVGHSDESAASPERHDAARRKRSEILVSETF